MLTRPRARKLWMRIPSHAMLRCCLVWVLCLCAWRGPVPVFHCHAIEVVDAFTDIESDWQLAEHVAVCHAFEQHGHGAEDLGWHIHFVTPSSGPSQAPHDLPVDCPGLADAITHDVEDDRIDVPVSSRSVSPLADMVSPFHQPSLSPMTPKLIPLAPPRSRPSRVSPRIYYCVVQC